jgi:hypothetical protein
MKHFANDGRLALPAQPSLLGGRSLLLLRLARR